MSDDKDLNAAIDQRDAGLVRQQVLAREFILINILDEEEEEDDEQMGALTAAIDDFEALVAFTSEENAGNFVQSQGEMFQDDDEVQGFLVEGDALLEYLPESFGLLINPETDEAKVIDPAFAGEVIGSSA